MMAGEPCPGCGGRGIVVSLNTVMACGRCHGRGSIDPVRESIERARRDAESMARIQASIAEHAELLKLLASELTRDEERAG